MQEAVLNREGCRRRVWADWQAAAEGKVAMDRPGQARLCAQLATDVEPSQNRALCTISEEWMWAR